MYEFMEEMEELAFRELEPEAHASVSKRLADLRAEAGGRLEAIAADIAETIAAHGVTADVSGREKRPYSIWRKMKRRHLGFEQLADVIAFRAVVSDEEACYRALGALHVKWPLVPGRFKDMISTPRPNGYRSLHTTVMHRNRTRTEIQIRTPEMHREAELGVAAHWAYKQGANGREPVAHYPWVRDLLDILEHSGSPEETARAHAARNVPESGLRLHPQRRTDPASRRIDARRFRLCGAYRSRRYDRGREGERHGRPAPLPARQRRSGGDPALVRPGTRSLVGRVRRHRQGARRDTAPQPRSASATSRSPWARNMFEALAGRLATPVSDESVAAALKAPETARPRRAVPGARPGIGRGRGGAGRARAGRRKGKGAPRAGRAERRGDHHPRPYARPRRASRPMRPGAGRPDRGPAQTRRRHRGPHDRLSPPSRRGRAGRVARSLLGRRRRNATPRASRRPSSTSPARSPR